MSENNNGHQRSLNDWLLRLDEKLDKIHEHLSKKADVDRVEKIEERQDQLSTRFWLLVGVLVGSGVLGAAAAQMF